MNDFEINKAVARELGFIQQGRGWISGADGIYDYIAKPNDDYRIAMPDYCNNASDAWPIITANKISVMFDSSTEVGNYAEWWLAASPCDQFIEDYVSSDKVLRAAMIVFLKMKGEYKS